MIQNSKTGEIITVETYKKRCDIEDATGLVRGDLREWTTEQIEQEYYNLFLHDVEVFSLEQHFDCVSI